MKATILSLGLALLLIRQGAAVIKCIQGDGSDLTATDCSSQEAALCFQ